MVASRRRRAARPTSYVAEPFPESSRFAGRVENRTWEPEEDEALLGAIGQHGPRWKLIAKGLPGRTEAMCRNRYQRINAPKNGASSRNHCTYCGELKRGHTCWAKQTLVIDQQGMRPRAPRASPDVTRPDVALAVAPLPLLLPPSDAFSLAPPASRLVAGRGGERPHLGGGGDDAAPGVEEIETASWGMCALPPVEHPEVPDSRDACRPSNGVSPTPTHILADADSDIAPQPPRVADAFEADADVVDAASGEEDARSLDSADAAVCDPAASPAAPPPCAAPPLPSRLAHSFDLRAMLATPPAGEDDGSTMLVPLDMVVEGLLSTSQAELVSSQDSSLHFSSQGPACQASAEEALAHAQPLPTPEKEAIHAMLNVHKLPSFGGRAPSFSTF